MPTIWRLCSRRHAARALDGEGARRFGGRWNSRGTPVVYLSSTLSLCVLEMLAHVDVEDAPDDLVAIPVTYAASVRVRVVSPASLPAGWRAIPPSSALAQLGDRWAEAGRTALLAVPSAIVPRERNFLLNPKHPAFARLRIGKPERFALDPRLRGAR